MKTESNIKPSAPFEIENLGEFADIIFYENIEPVMRDDDAEHWRFDAYRLTGVRNRDGLAAAVTANLAAWLEMAKKRAPEPPTEADRIAALESAMLDTILGGA